MDEISDVIVNILKDTSYPNLVSPLEFQWMKDIEKLSPFYEWFTSSITKNNYVTRDELLCFNHITKSGRLLSMEELDCRLSNYKLAEPTVFPDELNLDDFNSVTNKKKNVLEQLTLFKSQLEHKLQNKPVKSKCGDFVKELLKKGVRSVCRAEKKYNDQFHSLDAKIRIILDNLSNLESGVPKYLCQHDLSSYELRNITLDIHTETLKKKIFHHDKPDDSESNIMLDERVNNVFCWLCDIEYKNGCYEAFESAVDQVIKYLSDCEANFGNFEEFFTNENKYIHVKNKPVRPSEEDLLKSCEFYVTDTVRGIQLNVSKERLFRKREKLLLLSELEKIVETRKLCNNSLYCLLVNEWKTIRATLTLVKDLLNCLRNDYLEYEQRMTCMKGLKFVQDTQTFSESAVNPSSSSLMLPVNQSLRMDGRLRMKNLSIRHDTQTFSESAANQSLSISYNQQKNCFKITKFKENISKNFQNNLTIHRNIYREIMKVDRLIFNGPTRNVRYTDDIVRVLNKIYSVINCSSLSIHNEMDDFKKFKESLENNYDLYHMMWYEWQKNPYNVIEAILKLESSNEIRNRRDSMMIGTELSSKEFEEYRFF
ncbi:hypothetical protein O3M35_005982 [Rhynocoris fuscipes]|uniref:HAUS augmin-like complex subunit 3 N-terminal domain-containing protein n=1 Tax=Rhynocoris fuscipes TaxID=488301 RepID=A0AAW1DE71_9HEMI